ncbi:MAG: GNAT family N-acetyltransferase [Planctomycetales bacterium]|nr:GNAT family N-acetyltransferase [Planctomycetales bacterium]
MPEEICIRTRRLDLRPIHVEDFDGWAEFHAHAESMKYMGGQKSRSEAWRSFCTMAGAWSLYGVSMFSVLERGTRNWIGRVGAWQPEGWPGPEVGWGILHRYQGQGLALEAAVASIDFVFDRLKWEHIIHTINPDNVASIRLAERLGSRFVGPTRLPEPLTQFQVDCYQQSRSQWSENRLRFMDLGALREHWESYY